MVLQSDNGSEFIAEIVEKLMEIWPEAKIIHGRACHPQSQGSVKRENQDIKTMLSMWFHDHNTNNWVLGLNFAQLAKNTRHHSEIVNEPYTVIYGQHNIYSNMATPTTYIGKG
jgi:transposase InsO family protein